MFTGLIEEVGGVTVAVSSGQGSQRLQVEATAIGPTAKMGDSIAVNGCCLTVSSLERNVLGFDLLDETLKRTNLRNLAPGSSVNLERAVRAGAPLGGHFVQGHVDCAAAIVALDERSSDLGVEVQLPAEFARYVVSKGSIAVNGISLTVADVLADSFVVWIIPHTRTHTNLGKARVGDLVNLEFDLLAKYVERLLAPRDTTST